MELPLTFNLEYYNRQGEQIAELTEWEQVMMHIDADLTDWDQYSLFINNKHQDLFLKKIDGEKKLVTDYLRLGAGHYKVKVTYQKQVSSRQFSISSRKISSNAYSQMLEELVCGLPADISISLNNLGAYTGIKITQVEKVTIAYEVLRLNRAFYGTDKKIGLKKILDAVSISPHHVLKTNEVWVKSEEVRKPNTARIAHSLVQSHNLTPSGTLIRLIDNRVEHSYNVYENQMLKLFVHQLRIKLFRLVKFFKVNKNEKLLTECESLLKDINISQRKASFLEQVDLPVNFVFKTSMVLLNVPIYRVALEGLLEFQKVFTTDLNNPELDSPLENTPFLYQKWGTLKVLSQLMRVAQDFEFVVIKQRLEANVMGGKTIKILPDGKAALVLYHPDSKTIVKFIPEKSYSKKGNPLKSISYTQKPDISIEVFNPTKGTKVYLFDPKYKLDSEENSDSDEGHSIKPKKMDVDKMHSYRDAIRNQEGERIVEFAAILYPGETVLFNKGLNAIRSNPIDTHSEGTIEKILKEALNFENKKDD